MNNSTEENNSSPGTRERFAEQTAEIGFHELQKHFAKGILINVDPRLDILEVAVQIHTDNTDQIKQWMDDSSIERAHDDHAKVWIENKSILLAVTVAPWVLVQDNK